MHPSAWSLKPGTSRRCLTPSLLVTASAAVLLSGCTSSGDVTASIGSAQRSDSSTNPEIPGGALAMPEGPGPSNVAVTPHQHDYLGALHTAGVYRSSDLMALSIGSYVCQARAAGQDDTGVWDFVFPLVRGDIHDSDGAGTPPTMTMSAHDATAQYIRIASERLC